MTGRLLFLSCLLLATGCGEPEPDASEPEASSAAGNAARPGDAEPQPAPPPPPAPAQEDAEDAAAALRTYYALIGEREYDRALAMRPGDRGGAARLAANFAAYRSYRADVGAPSLPVAAGGWEYVEVPVMITGSFKGGKPFASSGSVTMRRANEGRPAPLAERRWHIHTG